MGEQRMPLKKLLILIIITLLLQLSSLLEQVGYQQSSSSDSQNRLPQTPKFVFELKYSNECESKFQCIAKDHGTMFAFHGSSVDNFYSIVHNGLLNLFNKASSISIQNVSAAK